MSVLFVGLGAMGTPMATRLAAAGQELILCDLKESYARELAERLGATPVPHRGGPSRDRDPHAPRLAGPGVGSRAPATP